MSWTSGSDLKAQLSRLWERGDLLRPLAIGADPCPLRLRFKAPGNEELASEFEAVRSWLAELTRIEHIRIEWREVHHRVLGMQRLPQAIWIDRLTGAHALLEKQQEATRFAQLVAHTRAVQPRLLDWVAQHPLQTLALEPKWPSLLAVARWVGAHPRPGIYLRQVDIPGVHSKFIETYRAVLIELLDRVLPAEAIDAEHTGVNHFAARYGFLDKPSLIRFRVLDSTVPLLHGPRLPDLALDANSFAELNIRVRRVFITENETNFLAFPPVPDSIVIFGAGYGWDVLAKARWLDQCAIYYWGDIDTHGYAILDQLRSHFAHVTSFLMDRATLMAHEYWWGDEPMPTLRELNRLNEAEKTLYEDIRDNRIGHRHGLRLEQERIGFSHVHTALGTLLAAEASSAAAVLQMTAPDTGSANMKPFTIEPTNK